MNCDCINKINAQLAKEGLALSVSYRMPNFEPFLNVQTVKLTGKGKSTPVAASFCPFCGTDCRRDYKTPLRQNDEQAEGKTT